MAGLRKDQIDVLMAEGTFRGLKKLRERGAVTPAEEKIVIAGTYKAILEEVAEARRELSHIQNALAALAGAAQNAQRAPAGPAADNFYNQFTNHLITFDAWVVSLLETDLTMTGLLNPGHTRNKITEMAKAMNALMDKRAAERHPVLDDPNLFRGYVDR